MLKSVLTILLLLSTIFCNANAQGLKVFISMDMEGIVGVVNSDQVSFTGKDYNRFRMIMTGTANAAIQGALDAGATEIVINDSHSSMVNILIEHLNPAARLLSGSPKKLLMMEGIDETFDAAIFLGYHASMGTENAILDHSMYSKKLVSVKMNGKTMNEASINAAIAGYFGVPVVFMAGDKAFVDQTRTLIKTNFEAVAVKEGVSRTAALSLPVEEAHKRIRAGVKIGVENRKKIGLSVISPPILVEIEYLNSGLADMPSYVPNVKRISGTKLSFKGEDYLDTFNFWWALVALGGA